MPLSQDRLVPWLFFAKFFFFRFEEKSQPQLFVHRWGLGGVPNVFFVGGEAFFFVFSMDEVTMNHIHES